ncbi:sigma-70 family RNA polymerase sigma factor [Streptomyces sp. NA04227]|uniref:sigma-70 family RNA polymerase sigma factor n=1 Tax=Streptomyces sp. NA04227 TaxID=2742136 RepID=UPI00158FDD4F|nr:sigma-70 family RNA polymerase sigma factor [Streptomyces sp. NA04227]QKW06965.1 sigma-70 family RNA polymerase sigma factor [Streptomyces sp. NA04227]
MDQSQLPEPYASLARLADGEPTLDQAAALTRALENVPALQRWLKAQRGRVVSDLRQNHSRKEIASRINCTPQRVSDILQGHSRGAGPRRTVRPED